MRDRSPPPLRRYPGCHAATTTAAAAAAAAAFSPHAHPSRLTSSDRVIQ